MKDPLSIYAPANRIRLIVVAGLLISAIALVDWATKPYISLGFLYLFPIMILGGFLSRSQILGVALVCAVLQEAFSNLLKMKPWSACCLAQRDLSVLDCLFRS